MEQIEQDVLFSSLTRPILFAGVTVNYFIGNFIFAAELFLITKSIWSLIAAIIIHLVGVIQCTRDPLFFDLWLLRVNRCPRVKNYAIWQCNSYRP